MIKNNLICVGKIRNCCCPS